MNALQKAGALVLLKTCNPLDAMQLCRAFNRAYNTSLDWHEFSSYLDQLHNKGLLEIAQSGGFVQYRLSE